MKSKGLKSHGLGGSHSMSHSSMSRKKRLNKLKKTNSDIDAGAGDSVAVHGSHALNRHGEAMGSMSINMEIGGQRKKK